MENTDHSLLVEKYRPNILDNYVGNKNIKSALSKIQTILANETRESNEMLKIYQKYVTNNEQITKEDDTIHGIFGDHTIRKEVKPPTIDYNLVLGEELSQNIVNNYPWFYNYFKY